MSSPESGDPAWRALPVAAVAALYVDGVQRFVRQNLLAFGGAGTGIAISDSLGWREFAAIAALILLVGLLLAMVYHRRFRYRVDADSVHVRQGLLEQKELRVRFERVQNVGFSQPFYLRPLGLRRVTLETPGAAQAEVELPGIAEHEALALRDRVHGAKREARAADGADEAPAESAQGSIEAPARAGEVIFRASAADLFRHGLTSNQIWILLAFFGGPAAGWIEARVERGIAWLTEAGVLSAGDFADAPWIVAGAVLALLVAVALLLMLMSGLSALVRFHGFTLGGDDERFRARFGLLDAREKTLRRSRLHSVEFVQTALGRVAGTWHAIGHQTGTLQAAETPGLEDQRFLVPGVPTARLPDVVGALRQRAWTLPELAPVDRHLRTITWTRLAAPPAGLAAVLTAFAPPIAQGPALIFASVAALLAGAIHLSWKRWGWLCDQDRLIVRSGLVGQRWIAFDLDRIQQIRVTTSPYQRRHGLATLHFRLPHGEQMLPYLPAGTAADLANRALLAAERSRSHAL